MGSSRIIGSRHGPSWDHHGIIMGYQDHHGVTMGSSGASGNHQGLIMGSSCQEPISYALMSRDFEWV